MKLFRFYISQVYKISNFYNYNTKDSYKYRINTSPRKYFNDVKDYDDRSRISNLKIDMSSQDLLDRNKSARDLLRTRQQLQKIVTSKNSVNTSKQNKIRNQENSLMLSKNKTSQKQDFSYLHSRYGQKSASQQIRQSDSKKKFQVQSAYQEINQSNSSQNGLLQSSSSLYGQRGQGSYQSKRVSSLYVKSNRYSSYPDDLRQYQQSPTVIKNTTRRSQNQSISNSFYMNGKQKVQQEKEEMEREFQEIQKQKEYERQQKQKYINNSQNNDQNINKSNFSQQQMSQIYEILHSGAKVVEEYNKNKLKLDDLHLMQIPIQQAQQPVIKKPVDYQLKQTSNKETMTDINDIKRKQPYDSQSNIDLLRQQIHSLKVSQSLNESNLANSLYQSQTNQRIFQREIQNEYNSFLRSSPTINQLYLKKQLENEEAIQKQLEIQKPQQPKYEEQKEEELEQQVTIDEEKLQQVQKDVNDNQKLIESTKELLNKDE